MDYFLFILTFTSVSLMPGLCMSLAFSLGLSLGYRQTLYMMLGELIGLGIVVIACGLGASFILQYELFFKIFKFLGALYLFYVAFILFRTQARVKEEKITHKKRFSLFFQGFITSLSNPKAWIFILSILPSFLNLNVKLWQLCFIILLIEFISLNLYALGGSIFKTFMNKHLDKLNKFSALCVGILALSMLLD